MLKGDNTVLGIENQQMMEGQQTNYSKKKCLKK